MGRMKHIELKFLFIQSLVKEGRVAISKIPGESNSSDLGTKYLERTVFEKHRKAAGLVSRSKPAGTVAAVEVEDENRPGEELDRFVRLMRSCTTWFRWMLQ